MTPNLGSWFVLHGVSMEPSCLLCGEGLNPSQGLQPLGTGSSSAATSAPSNHKHQVPWPSFSFHICLKARRSWAGHTGPCVAGSKDPARAPAARVRGTIRGGWACGHPRRTRGGRHGVAGMPGEARSGSTVAQDRLVLELWSVVFENPFLLWMRCCQMPRWHCTGTVRLRPPSCASLFLSFFRTLLIGNYLKAQPQRDRWPVRTG